MLILGKYVIKKRHCEKLEEFFKYYPNTEMAKCFETKAEMEDLKEYNPLKEVMSNLKANVNDGL